MTRTHNINMTDYYDIYESKRIEKIVEDNDDIKEKGKEEPLRNNNDDVAGKNEVNFNNLTRHTGQQKENNRGKQTKFLWIYRDMVYRCKDCGADQMTIQGAKSHLKTLHNAKLIHGIKPGSLENVTSYVCKVGNCNKLVKPFYDTIRLHFKQRHKMTVRDYHKTYETKMNIIEPDITEPHASSPQIPKSNLKSKIIPPSSKTDLWSGVRWYNRCKFMCQLCNEVCNGYEIRSHMASKHKQRAKKEYFPITTDKYKCKICDMTISFLQIKSHVYIKHKLVFNEYGKKFESRNLNRKEKKQNNQNKIDNLEVKAELTLNKNEDLSSSKRKVDDLASTPKIKRQKCILRCNICSLVCYSVPAMKRHIMADHEGKSTSSFTGVNDSQIEDSEGKTTPKEYIHHKVKKEVSCNNLVELVDNILKSNSEKKDIETNKEIKVEPSHQTSVENKSKNVETAKHSKKETFYRCPFKTNKNGSGCDYELSKNKMKWKNSAMAMDHLQMEHYEQAQQETRIKWIKITA